MATVLGTLTIDVAANTSSFTTSMSKMSELSGRSANDVKRSLERITAAGIAMASAIAAGTAALVKNALNTADRMDELAQSAGTTTDKLSALAYAAKFSSVSTEDLSGTLVKLSKSAFAAQNGNKELEAVYKRLGVSVTDSNGHLKDSGDLFQEIAPKFASMSDGAGKTALALLLLGRSGAASIPVLNQLGENVGELSKQAQDLGLVIKSDTAKAAGDINDNFDRLKLTFKGVGLSIMETAIPALKDLTVKLLNLSKQADFPDIGKALGEKLGKAIRTVGEAIDFAKQHAEGLTLAIKTLLALQVAKFAIPFLAELSSASLLGGIGKFVAGILGLTKLLPILTKLSVGFAGVASDLLFFVRYEGLATTATYAFGTALSFLAANPIIAVGAAIVGLTTLLYKLKTANDDARVAAEKHRNTLLATSGIRVPDELKGVKLGNPRAEQLNSLLAFKPNAVISLPDKPKAAPDTSGIKKEKDAFDEEIKKLNLAISTQQKFLDVVGAVPEEINRVTSSQRAEGIILELNIKRTDAQQKALSKGQEAQIHQLVALEDSKKALAEYGKAIVDQTDNADLAAKQQQNLTAALFSGRDATKVATADNVILGLQFNKTADEIAQMSGRMAALHVALLKKADIDSFSELAKTIDEQQKSTALATEQSYKLAAAQSSGVAAVDEAAIANTILGLTYDKNAEQIKALQPQIDRLTASLRNKAAADKLESTNKDVFSLSTELTARQAIPAAILAGEDALRKATLAQKLFSIEQEITASKSDELTAALIKKRDLLIQTTEAENNEADARDALSLKSVASKYEEDTAALRRQVDALTEGGKRNLSYGEALQVAAREQDNMNKALEEQVNLLTRSDKARDGVTAFFLDMQRNAIHTADIVFRALNSAFDKISDNFTKLITGQKTEFGQALKDIGQQVVGDTIKQQLQHALTPIGKALGIDLGVGKADGSKEHPFYVIGNTGGTLSGGVSGAGSKDVGTLIGDQIAKAIGGKLSDPNGGGFIFHALGGSKGVGPGAGTASAFGKPDGTRGNPFYVISLTPTPTQASAGKTPGIFSGILGQLIGAGASAALGNLGGAAASGESVTSSITFPSEFAPEKVVSPQAAYLVPDAKPNLMSANSASMQNSPETRTATMGNTYNVSVDARGTDPVLVEERTRRGILAAHNSAVGTAVQASIEIQKRTPQRI